MGVKRRPRYDRTIFFLFEPLFFSQTKSNCSPKLLGKAFFYFCGYPYCYRNTYLFSTLEKWNCSKIKIWNSWTLKTTVDFTGPKNDIIFFMTNHVHSLNRIFFRSFKIIHIHANINISLEYGFQYYICCFSKHHCLLKM